MKKIDRLGWAAALTFESFGARVGLRVNDARLLETLAAHLPPGWKHSKASVVERLYSVYAPPASRRRGMSGFHLLYGDHVRLARSKEAKEVFEVFESELQRYVAESARRGLFVHAGAVGWRGRAVVLPGRSFSGKSTLVAELVRAGATYYSDEYAVIDRRGRVHPFSRPIGMREGTGKRKVTIESLNGAAGARALPVGLVVVSEYKEGARWRPQQLSSGRGVLELLAHTVSARRDPANALGMLERVATGARVLKGARGEARETAASILEALELY